MRITEPLALYLLPAEELDAPPDLDYFSIQPGNGFEVPDSPDDNHESDRLNRYARQARQHYRKSR